MTQETIDEVLRECKRFVGAAKEAKRRLAQEERMPMTFTRSYQLKETAALRRASMDLTRALVDLRR